MATQTDTKPEIHHLQITAAHHKDGQFYTLARVMPTGGGAMLDWNGAIITDVTHEVPPAALFSAIQDEPCEIVNGQASHPVMCVLLDACDVDGDIFDNREITMAAANKLLDDEFETRLKAARENLGYYDDQEAGQ